MFVTAIEKVKDFTRPIYFISKNYGYDKVFPGTGTLFFVNELGCAVTCRHVAEQLIIGQKIHSNYKTFKDERDKLVKDGKFKTNLKALEQKYKFGPDITVQMKVNYVDSVDSPTSTDIHMHTKYDLAIIQFKGFKKLLYKDYAIFFKEW